MTVHFSFFRNQAEMNRRIVALRIIYLTQPVAHLFLSIMCSRMSRSISTSDRAFSISHLHIVTQVFCLIAMKGKWKNLMKMALITFQLIAAWPLHIDMDSWVGYISHTLNLWFTMVTVFNVIRFNISSIVESKLQTETDPKLTADPKKEEYARYKLTSKSHILFRATSYKVIMWL